MKDGCKMPTMYYVWWRRVSLSLKQDSVTQMYVTVVESQVFDVTLKPRK